MKDIKDYKEYKSLYKDDLVVAVRKLLKRIEDKGDYELEDSSEHNNLKHYFNRFGLHQKLSAKDVENWKL
jgi:hypothetical protein